MQFVKRIWAKGRKGKTAIGCGGLLFVCSTCTMVSLIWLAVPQGRQATQQRNATAGASTLIKAEIANAPTATAWLTRTPMPTNTSQPSNTPHLNVPTATARPTRTSMPTNTSQPSNTPRPNAPTVPVTASIPTPPATNVRSVASVMVSTMAPGGGGNSNAFTCIGGCATPPDPSCAIKGNVNSRGEKIYHVPGQRDYERTDVNPEEGDRWFCTPEEAQAAGFRPAKR
jgi:hypothetical protein